MLIGILLFRRRSRVVWAGAVLNFALKLSEKSRRCVKRGLPGHRSATIWPVSAPIYRPNPSSERCSYPFSDSFLTAFSEVRSLRFVWFLEAAEILQLLDAFRPDQDVGVGGEGVRPLDGETGLKVLVATGSRSPVLQQQ